MSPHSFCAALLSPVLALGLAGCASGPPPKVAEVAIEPAPRGAEAAPAPPAPREPAAPAPKGDPLLGRSKDHAIDVCGPPGQRAYLSSLRCAVDGQTPTFDRAGNVGSRNEPAADVEESVLWQQMDPRRPLRRGEIDYHIVDRYRVVCADGEQSLYLDMYHCAGPQTSSPPSGFTMTLEGGV